MLLLLSLELNQNWAFPIHGLDSKDRARQMGHIDTFPVCSFSPMVQWDGIYTRNRSIANGTLVRSQSFHSFLWYSEIGWIYRDRAYKIRFKWDDPSPSIFSIGTVGYSGI